MSAVSCGCCEGIGRLTPASTVNRPGLSALRYRVGTHAQFLSSMLARLSSPELSALRRLTTRDPHDPSIALLDAWAVAADVLTFYTERIANEGYLRTATERRSILELAGLIDYRVRPGVSASVYLAYGVEQGHQVTIPAGSPAQSVPGPGEKAQTFETSEPVLARDVWSQMKLRTTRPQLRQNFPSAGSGAFWVKGTDSGLATGSGVAFVYPDDRTPAFRLVTAVEPDNENNRTRVLVGPAVAPAPPKKVALNDLLAPLAAPPGRPPASAARLTRSLDTAFAANGDALLKLLGGLRPAIAPALHQALSAAPVTDPQPIKVFAFRVQAPLFGHNANKDSAPEDVVIKAAPIDIPAGTAAVLPPSKWTEWDLDAEEGIKVLFLDSAYPGILPGSVVAVSAPDGEKILDVEAVRTFSRNAYGMPSKTTRIDLKAAWRPANVNLDHLRKTTAYAQPEELDLAEEPIGGEVCGKDLEFDALYDALEPGRWLIVTGERSDIAETPGIQAAELVMIAEVHQDVKRFSHFVGKNGGIEEVPFPGDREHTFLRLANQGLAYCYKLDTVRVYGNVVHATHGETRQQVLGSGDASKLLQRFTLRQPPLTHVSAPTTSGLASTLVVRVDDIRWHEARSLADLGPNDRGFVTQTDDAGVTDVVFGTGERGARLPTGGENVRATFRSGIGRPGNVKAAQITGLTAKPLGVKEVVNPLPATGGADPESRDRARENAPLAVRALDRLVSVQDYADFARTFAGVGKASATRLSDGRRQFVHVTIAGADDIPLGLDSDLLRNLGLALRRFGDPSLPVRVGVRQLLALVVVGSVNLHPDHEWEVVEPKLRAALLDAFGFDRRALAQDVTSGEVLQVMHTVAGVTSVDLDILDTVAESAAPEDLAHLTDAKHAAHLGLVHRLVASPARARPLRPAQLAVLVPSVPETLILQVRTT